MVVCERCVMDSTAIDFVTSDLGCNFCDDFSSKFSIGSELSQRQSIENLLVSVERSRSKNYDCIVGVSGGVDSSYVLYLVVKAGLRPLAVHLDNGWNSELAVSNINNLIESLGVDLYTHVIDWEENKNLQRSFFAADVVDIEMLMDNAMLRLNYSAAKKFGLRYILSGSNSATEGMRMPRNWNWLKFDAANIKSIHKRFGNLPIKTHKLTSISGFIWNEYFRKVKWIPFLDYYDYVKEDALAILERECGYKRYPYKHYESVFTRFYQGYILPKKFGIDKRKLHLSTLIVSGQMTRDEALELLSQDPYPNQDQLRSDYEFVLDKLGFTEAEFAHYLSRPRVEHDHYRSYRWVWDMLVKLRKKLVKA